MPTPRLLLEEWEKNEYEQYGLVLNIFEQSEDADTKFLLHILISDSKIMSLFSFEIPYIFFIWLCLEETDMFSELQLMLAIDNSGKSKISSILMLAFWVGRRLQKSNMKVRKAAFSDSDARGVGSG